MAKNAKGAFDEILEKFGTDEDRQSFEVFADKNPFLKESVLRQSDYSRKMDELRDQVSELNEWHEWRQNNWDDDRKMTRTELAKLEKLEALQSEKAALESRLLLEGGGEMNFAELEAQLNDWGKKQGYVTPGDVSKTLEGKERELREFVTGMNGVTARAATRIPYLMIKHSNEFGAQDLFDPEEFFQKAAQQGQFGDLDKFYEREYAAPARQKKTESAHIAEVAKLKEEVEAARTAGERAGELKISQGVGGAGMPTDGSGPAMAPFQAKYLGLDKPKEVETGAPEVGLGEGGLAAFAANKYLKTGSL